MPSPKPIVPPVCSPPPLPREDIHVALTHMFSSQENLLPLLRAYGELGTNSYDGDVANSRIRWFVDNIATDEFVAYVNHNDAARRYLSQFCRNYRS